MKRAKLLEMEEYIRFRQTISFKGAAGSLRRLHQHLRRFIATILSRIPTSRRFTAGSPWRPEPCPGGTRSFTRSEAPEIQNVSEKQRLAATRPPGSGPRHYLY